MTITKLILEKIEAVEMWFWRRMSAKKTNIEVIEEAGQTRSLVNGIKTQRAVFIGHLN